MKYLKSLWLKLNLKDLFLSKRGYIYYIVGEGLSKGVIFLLLAFYTNVLDKESFGKLALFWVSVPLFSVLIDLSQRSYIKHFYIHKRDEIIQLLNSIKLFSLLSFIFLLLVFFSKNELGIYIIDKKSDLFVLFSAMFFAIIELNLSYLQIKGDFKNYNLIFILRNSFPYIIAAIILHYFGGDVYTFMRVQLILFVIISLVLLFGKSVKINFNDFLNYIKPSIKFSSPFIPAMISVMALSFADRFIINYYYSGLEVAEYTVAYTISSIFMAFFMATNKMWQKFILENLKSKNLNKITKASKSYILIVFIVGFSIILFREPLILLMSNKLYLLIIDIVPTIIIGMFFYFLYTILSNIPFYYKNTLIMALPAIIAALLNIILNFVLIPKYGYKVAAITTTISYAVQFIIIYLICLRKYKIDILFNGITKRFIS